MSGFTFSKYSSGRSCKNELERCRWIQRDQFQALDVLQARDGAVIQAGDCICLYTHDLGMSLLGKRRLLPPRA